MNKSDIDLRKEWEQLPTPDLEAMLQAELEKTPPDDDIVLALLHILEAREPEELPEVTDREREAFERYKWKVAGRRKKPIALTRWLSLAACGVLILGLFFNVVPQKAQAETFWEMLQRLSTTVIEFFGREDVVMEKGYAFETDNEGLQQVYDAVMELGVTEPVVPMWLPEGYELSEFTEKSTPMLSRIHAAFSNDIGEIVYKVDIYKKETTHQYYRDDSFYDSYERNGATYTISRNNDRWTVVWGKENIECSIFIDCQEDTLRRILKSIYVMEE